ncbi:MAG: lytic transglycosylase [Magnetococcales bacterium]|nr:lytic transglycosylase [Magnetococcales bacterium]MBF0151013.1 lytic transglycosylase [Magnetococcales bacterium]MBF0172711.1 lytic transglycosylase [Magnetococcales bacterium]MBF0347798.1 lytic transglycosylase [Magnetococcales bacterium]MBF0629425.1 lytic transglycosylase [Magnetococcales bacterium]
MNFGGWVQKLRQTIWLLLPILTSCATVPANIDQACILLDGRDDWYRSLRATEKKWGTPMHVQLAIIHQESKFRSDAKPPRKRWLGFIPGPRISSAFGYAQALDDTWEWYKIKTGNAKADRDEFEDAVDFIGWYSDQSHKILKLSKWDAKSQYLAYHEGHKGYKNKSYLKKPWLMAVSDKVAQRAADYKEQLRLCRQSLDQRPSFSLF